MQSVHLFQVRGDTDGQDQMLTSLSGVESAFPGVACKLVFLF